MASEHNSPDLFHRSETKRSNEMIMITEGKLGSCRNKLELKKRGGGLER